MSNNLSNVVPIKNAINFRDLGGIVAQDGRKIRPGLLFRAGAFHQLDELEKHSLSDNIKLKYILDYRDEVEIQANPDNLWANSTYIHAPANPLNDEVTANLAQEIKGSQGKKLKKDHPSDFMVTLYQLLPFNNSAYQTLVDLLLNSGGQSIVQHCAIGKDRTGVGVALTLFALGVDEETVIQDYLFTEQSLASYRNKLLTQFAETLTPEELEKRRQLFSAKIEYLQAALDAIKDKYSSIDDWLATEYQLNDKNRQIIQSHYLE